MKPTLPGVVVVLFFLTLTARAADWPQYRGPNRDGVSAETGLSRKWPAAGPKLLWSLDNLGLGYSGPAIVGDRLYISAGRGDSDVVIALDIKDPAAPKELWSARLGPLFTWKGNNWNIGPNATPTVDGDLLYALGGHGDLTCIETATGKERWRKNLPKDFAGEVNPIGGGAEEPTPLGWGYAWSPLVDGQQLIIVPGGKRGLLAALDKKTGDLLWQSAAVKAQAPYASPILAQVGGVGGVKHYIQVTNAGLVGIAPKDGKLLWSYQRTPAYDDVVVATPIFHDGHVFSTVGFGQGCDLLKLTKTGEGIAAEKVYSSRTMQNRDGGVVLLDGHLYGHSEAGGWLCMNLQTGKVAWNDREFPRGAITATADGLLICTTEKGGQIALLEANPKARTELSRFTLPKESAQRRSAGGMWTHPVICNGKLYVRDQENLFCYDVARASRP